MDQLVGTILPAPEAGRTVERSDRWGWKKQSS